MKKKEKIKNKGFTLIEVLSVIVVIAIIGGISTTVYLNTINNSKTKSSILALDNVKKAAELYSKESINNINWITNYNEFGNIDGRYICISVEDLINAGFFKKDSFKNEIYKSNNNEQNINYNTIVEISQENNYANTSIKIHNDNITKNKCIESFINKSINSNSKYKFDSLNLYTDTIDFKIISDSNDTSITDVTATYTNKNNTEKTYNCDGNKCKLEVLKNKTVYNVKLCMNINNKRQCNNNIKLRTAEFEPPTISITNHNKWSNNKVVTITYNNDNIINRAGIHLFKSEIEANINSGTVYLCDDNGKNCNNTKVTTIEKNKWYKVTEDTVKFTIGGTNSNVLINQNEYKKITARIEDSSNNYKEVSRDTTQLDGVAPNCITTGGNDDWTKEKVTLTGRCTDEMGCKETLITKIVDYDVNGLVSPGIVYDKVGNYKECPGNKVMRDTTPPTCTVSGGTSTFVNKDITIVGTCTDATSDCTEATKIVKSPTYKDNTNTSVSPGTVYDNAKNSTVCDKASVKIDKTAPVVTISSTNDNYTLSITATDNVGVTKVRWGGSNYSTISSTTRYTTSATEATSNGAQKCYYAKDEAGNEGSNCSSTYKICSKTKVNENVNSTKNNATVQIYKYSGIKAVDCTIGDSKNDNSPPYRRYYFEEYACGCNLDKHTNKYCSHTNSNYYKLSGESRETHKQGHATIYYKRNNNGADSCTADNNVNTYVRKVCQHGSATEYGNNYHGYIFYSGEAKTDSSGLIFTSFHPTAWWFHNGKDKTKNNRVSSSSTTDEACINACKQRYS